MSYFDNLPIDLLNIIVLRIPQEALESFDDYLESTKIYEIFDTNSNWENIFIMFSLKTHQEIKNIMKIDKTLRGYQWKELYSDFKIVSKFFDIRDINTIFIYNKDVNIAGITDRGINMIASLELYRKYPYIYEKSKILPKSLISKVYLLDVLKRSNVINYIKYLTHGHSLGILSISYPSNLSWIYILIDDKLLNIIDHWSIIK